MKTLLLSLSMIVILSIQGFSQDIILKKNNEMVKCKIKEVGLDEVKYLLPEYSQDVIFSIDKDNIIKIIFENGEEMEFQKDMTNPDNYNDNRKNVLKTEFMSPLFGSTCFAWEHSLKPGRSIEATIGIVGLGLDLNDRNPGGLFVKFGYKLIKTPDFYLRGMKYAHVLKGSYIKPEIMIGQVRYDEYDWISQYDQNGYYSGYEKTSRESVFAGAVQIVMGKQWVFDNVFAIDPYVGLGYGFLSSSNSNDWYRNGFQVFSNDVPFSLSAGFKIGILIK